MEFIKTLSKIFVAPGIILLLWDLVEGWFVKNTVDIRTFKEWGIKATSVTTWNDAHNLLVKLGAVGGKIEQAPAFAVFLIPAVVFYLIYRILFMLVGEKTGGYKSRY